MTFTLNGLKYILQFRRSHERVPHTIKTNAADRVVDNSTFSKYPYTTAEIVLINPADAKGNKVVCGARVGLAVDKNSNRDLDVFTSESGRVHSLKALTRKLERTHQSEFIGPMWQCYSTRPRGKKFRKSTRRLALAAITHIRNEGTSLMDVLAAANTLADIYEGKTPKNTGWLESK